MKVRDVIKGFCKKCGGMCCTPTHTLPTYHITLYPGDIQHMLNLGFYSCLSISQAFNQTQFVIRPHIFGYCPFFDFPFKMCKIYEKRPLACKVFPFEPHMTPLKEKCLFFQKTKTEKRTQLVDKTRKKFASQQQRKMLLDDQKIGSEKYFSNMNFWMTKKPIFQTNKFGTFMVVSRDFDKNLHRNKLLKQLYTIIHEYSKFVNQKKVYISLYLLTSEYKILLFLKGIFGFFEETNLFSLRDNVTHRMNIYYEKLLNGSLLDGIIFQQDLTKDSTYWHPVWIQIKNIITQFQQGSGSIV